MDPAEMIDPGASSPLDLSLLESIPMPMFFQHPDGTYTGCNPAFEAFVGRLSVDLVGRRPSEIYPGEVVLLVDQTDWALKQGEKWQALETRLRRADGIERDVIIRKWPHRAVSGTIVGIMGVLADVTESKQAERLLRLERDLAIALGEVSSVEDAARLILGALFRQPGLDCGGLYLLHESSGDLNLVYHEGLSPRFVASASHFAADAPQTRLVMAGDPTYTRYDEMAVQKPAARRRECLRAAAIVPVRHGGRVIAALNVASHTHDDIPPSAREVLETITAHLGAMLAHISAEHALRESEARFRAILDNIPDMAWLKDRASRLIAVNKNYASAAGYDDPAQLVGKTVLECWPPEHARSYLQDDADVISSGHEKRIEETGVTTQGVRTLETIKRPWFDDGGKIAGTVGIAHDITVRKQLEEALRHREAYLSAIIENQPGLVWLKDAEGRFLAVNHTYAVACGQGTPENVVGKTDRDLWPGELVERYLEDDARVMRSGQPIEVEELIHDRGQARWFETFKAPVRDAQGNIIGTTGYGRDISERRRGEQALKASEERFRTLVQQVPAVVYISDPDDLCTTRYVSPQLEQMLGYSPDEWVAEPDLWQRCVHPDDRDRVLAEYNRVRASGQSMRCEYRISARDGHAVWVSEVSAVIRDADGRPAALQGLLIDITQRKRAEQERLEMERRLLEAQKLEGLGLMAGGIAHEFNNLLQAILGNLELALSDDMSFLTARSRVENAAASARQATHLTRQLLAYTGRGPVRPHFVDLCQVVDEVRDLLASAVSRGVRLDFQLDRPLPLTMAEPDQVRQIIVSLIANASEAIGERPGAIVVSTGSQDCDDAYLRHSRIEEKPRAGRFVYLQVADTGCGMDEKTLQRAFDPFFTTKFMGRGLGLSAVMGIVRAHHGAIVLDSPPGIGTTIKVLFPVAASGGAMHEESGVPGGPG